MTFHELESIAALRTHPGWEGVLSFLQKSEDDRLDQLEAVFSGEETLRVVDQWRAYRQVRRELAELVDSFLEEKERLSPLSEVEKTIREEALE